MLKQACSLCKVVGAIAIIGALNWGLVALANANLVEEIVEEIYLGPGRVPRA